MHGSRASAAGGTRSRSTPAEHATTTARPLVVDARRATAGSCVLDAVDAARRTRRHEPRGPDQRAGSASHHGAQPPLTGQAVERVGRRARRGGACARRRPPCAGPSAVGRSPWSMANGLAVVATDAHLDAARPRPRRRRRPGPPRDPGPRRVSAPCSITTSRPAAVELGRQVARADRRRIGVDDRGRGHAGRQGATVDPEHLDGSAKHGGLAGQITGRAAGQHDQMRSTRCRSAQASARRATSGTRSVDQDPRPLVVERRGAARERGGLDGRAVDEDPDAPASAGRPARPASLPAAGARWSGSRDGWSDRRSSGDDRQSSAGAAPLARRP